MATEGLDGRFLLLSFGVSTGLYKDVSGPTLTFLSFIPVFFLEIDFPFYGVTFALRARISSLCSSDSAFMSAFLVVRFSKSVFRFAFSLSVT